jgi:hypothetical protein
MNSLFTTLEQQTELSINICGTPCVGDCGTCVQSNADLTAFYEGTQADALQVFQALTFPEPITDETLEALRAQDEAEEALRSGTAFDQGDADCDCLDCRYNDYEDDRFNDYDGDCGVSWNESGYFD